MSNAPEFELDLDLQLLPAWARQPSTENRYSKFEGETEGDSRGRRGQRFGRFDSSRDRGPRRDRPPGGPPGQGRPQGRGGPGQGDRPGGPRFGPRRDGPQRQEVEEPRIPLPEIDVAFVPEEKGVESLARQIRLTGRAYPLFDIAGLVLRRPDKFDVRLNVVKTPEGQVRQPLLVCSLDGSLWLNHDEMVAHVLRNHFDVFYQTEKVAAEPPKGTYTFVAQCSLSGVILGPPNLHDYQQKLRKLHADRFSRMPFDVYKSRIRFVKDEAVVKQWVEEQSWKLEFVCLNVPEPLKLPTRDEVEKHFRSVHLPNLATATENHTLVAGAKRPPMSPGLHSLLRQAMDDQKRFPLRLATILSQMFAGHGLQFFKVNRTVTHVCVARPHFLDLEVTVVSDGIRRIVEFINARPNCTRRTLIAALAPTPPASAVPPQPQPAAPAEPAAAPQPDTSAAEAAGTPTETSTAPAAVSEPTPPAAPATPATPEAPPPTPEQTAVIADLHWLIHQGHVIEYTTGRLETAKAPKPPRPVQPQPTAAETPSASVEATAVAPTGDEVQPQGTPAAESQAVAEATPEAVPTASPDVQPETAIPDGPSPLPSTEAASQTASPAPEPPPVADAASSDTTLFVPDPEAPSAAPTPESTPPPTPVA
jgi:hypothetical protein